MIPFGLESLMTISLPIGRRATKCLVPGASAIYLFNEGSGQVLTDYSGNGNNGRLGSTTGADTNDPAWDTAGLLVGPDDYVSVGTGAGLWGQSMTVIAVVTQTQTGQYAPVVVRAPNTGYARDYTLTIKADGAVAELWFGEDASNHVPLASGAIYAANTPSFVCGVIDAAAGVATVGSATARTSATFTFTPTNKGHELCLGHIAGDLAQARAAHTLHAVLIYRFALTDAQIAQTYSALKGMLAPRGVVLP